MWFDCILCLILTPDGHPQVQEINAEFGVCCRYPMRLVASQAAECCGQVGLELGGSGVRLPSHSDGEAATHPLP